MRDAAKVPCSLSDDEQRQVRDIAERALELVGGAREGFLRGVCGENLELRREIDQILALAEDPRSPLDPIPILAAGVANDPLASIPPLSEFGGFVVERFVARGGMGEVYVARDRRLDRRVALKLLPFGAGPGELERFDREAKSLAKIDHPGIVKVLSVGTDHGRAYLAMEFVDGTSLADEIGAIRTGARPFGATLPPYRSDEYVRRVVTIIAEVADALQAAHECGIVHRDVKPANLLLDRVSGTVRIVDFGIARERNQATLTRTGIAPGTPGYMSPEQIESKGSAIDGRSDVYSLGVVLYESLTGVQPFERDDHLATTDSVLHELPPPLDRVDSRIPRDLVVLCGKAIEKRRDDRYASAGEFAADLRRFLRHETVLARPPTIVRRTIAVVRRHPAGFTIGVVAILLVLSLARDAWARQRRRIDGLDAVRTAMAIDPWESVDLLVVRRAIDLSNDLLGKDAPLSVSEGDEIAAFESRVRDQLERWTHEIDDHLARAMRPAELAESIAWHRTRAAAIADEIVSLDPNQEDFAKKAAEIRKLSSPRITVEAKDRSDATVLATVRIAEIEAASGLPRDFVDMGSTGTAGIGVAPGFYRLQIRFPTGEIVETDAAPGIEPRDDHLVVGLASPDDTNSDMTLIPSERVTFPDSWTCPLSKTTIDIPAYYIDRHEVTNQEYLAFCAATGHARPYYLQKYESASVLDRPVVGISWYDAVDYARYVNKRLPSHAEWELAARSSAFRLTPWANGLTVEASGAVLRGASARADTSDEADWKAYCDCVVAATAAPLAGTPTGVLHMLGNVAEYAAGPAVVQQKDGSFLVMAQQRPTLGGSFLSDPDTTLDSYGFDVPNAESHQIQNGFRCVRTANP